MFFKTGVTEVDEIKMRAGKEGTLQKVFLKTKIFREHLIDKHTWRHRCYQKLLLSLCFLRTSVLTIKISHRDEFPRINFTLNKISMKNLISFICLYYLKNWLFSYGKKLLRCSHLIISINMGFTENLQRLTEWQVQPQDSSSLIKLTQ